MTKNKLLSDWWNMTWNPVTGCTNWSPDAGVPVWCKGAGTATMPKESPRYLSILGRPAILETPGGGVWCRE